MKPLLAVLLVSLSTIGCQAQSHKTGYRSWGIYGLTDSTMLAYSVWNDGDTDKIIYSFDPKHYEDAWVAIQLSQIPFEGLNVMAQKEYLDKLKYIKAMKALPTTKVQP